MGNATRTALMRTFKAALGLDMDNDLLTYEHLIDRNERIRELNNNADPADDAEDAVAEYPTYF